MGKLARIFNAIVLVFLLSLLLVPCDVQAGTALNPTVEDGTLLQFASGGHVLGFGSGSVYLAGLDHSLRVDFADGHAVKPVAEGAGTAQNGVAPLGRVAYPGVWENVDVTYSAVAGGIAESTYIIHPGGNPSDISLRYNTPVEMEQGGALRLAFENGYVQESAPVAWQEINGRRVAIEVSFQRQGERQVGFALGHYDSNYIVYIDPTFTWNTFYGSTFPDQANAIAVDSAGNVYVAGISNRSWNGPAGQLPLNAYTAYYDITIVKLNSAGAYQWHTFYGSSSGNEYAYAIALDSASNVYVAGESNYTFNGPGAAPPLNPHQVAALADITIIKLSSAGAYLWHTFCGGTSVDQPYAIALDSANNIYVAGRSAATWGTNVQNPYAGGTQYDIVVVKLDSLGAYVWNTFYGSTDNDQAYAMALDSAGNIYVAGSSAATWNGPGSTPPLNAHTAGTNLDFTIVKLNNTGAYQWHTFYGSTTADEAHAIALDSAGNVYVAGSGYATWNGPAGQSPLNAYTASLDIIIIKLNSTGTYQWHTFYGSTSDDEANAIAMDPSGNVYVAGDSYDTWGAPLNAHTAGSNYDITILKLNSAGVRQWHTFYGSTSDDEAYAIALDSAHNIYVAGRSPATWGAPLNAHTAANYNDFAIIKMNDAAAPAITAVNPVSGLQGQTLAVTITGTNLAGATAVNFGTDITVNFTVNSPTQITANIIIAGATLGARPISLTTPGGTASKGAAFRVVEQSIGTTAPHGSSVSGPAPSSPPVSLSNIVVQSASLSTTTVSPNTPVTVTADIANKSTVNGNKQITVYVNGEIETTQGLTLNSGDSSKLTFNVSRSEPGTYKVYVDGAPAGSFKVEAVTASDAILIASVAFLAIAFVCGLFIMRRRQGITHK